MKSSSQYLLPKSEQLLLTALFHRQALRYNHYEETIALAYQADPGDVDVNNERNKWLAAKKAVLIKKYIQEVEEKNADPIAVNSAAELTYEARELYNTKNYADTILQATRALDSYKLISAYFLRACAYYYTHQFEQSLKDIQSIGKKNLSLVHLIYRGMNYAKLNQSDLAVVDFVSVLRQDVKLNCLTLKEHEEYHKVNEFNKDKQLEETERKATYAELDFDLNPPTSDEDELTSQSLAQPVKKNKKKKKKKSKKKIDSNEKSELEKVAENVAVVNDGAKFSPENNFEPVSNTPDDLILPSENNTEEEVEHPAEQTALTVYQDPNTSYSLSSPVSYGSSQIIDLNACLVQQQLVLADLIMHKIRVMEAINQPAIIFIDPVIYLNNLLQELSQIDYQMYYVTQGLLNIQQLLVRYSSEPPQYEYNQNGFFHQPSIYPPRYEEICDAQASDENLSLVSHRQV